MDLQSIQLIRCPAELDLLKRSFDSATFPKETVLVYKRHIPSIAFILLKGSLVKKATTPQLYDTPGTLFGLKELFEQKPFRFQLTVKEGSELLILDLFTLKKIFHPENGNISLRALLDPSFEEAKQKAL